MGGSLEALQAQGGRGAEAGKSQGKMLAVAVCSDRRASSKRCAHDQIRPRIPRFSALGRHGESNCSLRL